MATLAGLVKDATPPATDTELSPLAIPDGTTLLTTKQHNKIVDYLSGDAGPDFIPQLAIENLVSDLAGKEDSLGFTPENIANKVTIISTPGNDTNYPTEKAVRDALDLKENSLGFTPENIANKGATNGYAALVSGLVPIANLGTGTPDGTKFLRDDGTFVTPSGEVFIWSNNHDAANFNLLQVGDITSGSDTIHNWDMSRDATLVNDTVIGNLRFRAEDGLGVSQNYAKITGVMESDVDGAEEGSLQFFVTEAGVHDVLFMTINDTSDGQIRFLRPTDFNVQTMTRVSQIDADTALTLNASTANQIRLRVNNINEYLFDAAQADFLGNNIINLGLLQFGIGESIGIESNDMVLNVTVGDFFRFVIDGTDVMQMTEQSLQIIDKNIKWSETGFGHNIDVSATSMDINVGDVTDALALQTGTVDRILINGATDIDILLPTDFNANNIVGVTDLTLTNDIFLSDSGTLQWAGSSDRRLLNTATGFIFEIEAGDAFSFEIDSAVEYSWSASSLDLMGNNLINVGTIIMMDGVNVVLGSTTGTEWGTASTQKQAWWGVTPVVQPAHIADPAGGATVDAEARTAIDAILAQLAETGQQAAS